MRVYRPALIMTQISGATNSWISGSGFVLKGTNKLYPATDNFHVFSCVNPQGITLEIWRNISSAWKHFNSPNSRRSFSHCDEQPSRTQKKNEGSNTHISELFVWCCERGYELEGVCILVGEGPLEKYTSIFFNSFWCCWLNGIWCYGFENVFNNRKGFVSRPAFKLRPFASLASNEI